MSKKNENSKKTTWEKLNAEADETANESAIKEEAFSTKKSESSSNKLIDPSHEALKEQLQKAEAQLEEHKIKLAQYKEKDTYRLAEIENIRRRCKLDIENAYKFSLEKIIKELLPVNDYLEAALGSITEAENDPTLKGVQLTLQALQKALKNNGVKIIEPVSGQVFDPEHHQAMLTEESADQAPNTILKMLQKGYMLYERLIRPAVVVVAKTPEKNSQ